MFGRPSRINEDGTIEDCMLCDSVLAVAGALVGVVLIAIALDLLTKGGISGRISDRFDKQEVFSDGE